MCSISCSDDDVTNFYDATTSANLGTVSIDDDRLVFNSASFLEEFVKEPNSEKFDNEVVSFSKKGFKPLLPIFEENDQAAKRDFLEKKLSRINKDFKLAKIPVQQKSLDDDEMELSDNLIQDDHFANVLNEDRSIQVADSIYVYTSVGVFKSSINDESELFDIINAYEDNGSLYRNTDLPDLDNAICRSSNNGKLSLKPKTTVETQITDKISVIQVDGCYDGGGNTGGGDTTGGSNTTGNIANSTLFYPFMESDKLDICQLDDESIWQQVFGAAETCHDYFASDRRARVKFWNQNYLVFSSIGANVKHQKRNLGIWSASDATDFVELGINEVSFTYDYESSHLDQIYNNYATNTLIKYKGVTYKLDGSTITNTPLTVPNWPFNSDDPLVDGLEIYIFDNNVLAGLTWKEGNKLIRDTARDFIEMLGNDLETAALNDNLDVRGVISDPLSTKIQFNVVNRVERDVNDCCATHYFDWNVFISTKFDLEQYSAVCDENSDVFGGSCTPGGFNIDGLKVDAFNANSYEDLEVDIYGLVRRGGDTYRGRRIIGEID